MIDPATILPLLREGQPLRIYLVAVFGSVAVELAYVYRVYEAGRAFPKRYRRSGFWAARVLLALTAGGLALALRANNDPIAFCTGATAPAIIIAMSKRAPGSDGSA